MALPVPTKLFLEKSPDTAMLFAPLRFTHPPDGLGFFVAVVLTVQYMYGNKNSAITPTTVWSTKLTPVASHAQV